MMLSTDRTIVYANARFARLVDIAHERLLGSKLDDYVAPASRPLVDAILRERTAGAAKAEVELVALDGRLLPVYLSATASWDEDHRLTCMIATDSRSRSET